MGSVPFVSGEIAEDFASYYLTSQQQPSIVYLGVRVEPASGTVRAAGGVLVQPLPGCPEETLDDLAALSSSIGTFAKRLDDGERPEDILSDIFRELGFEEVAQVTPAYRCDCSRDRIEQALLSVGKKELTDMIHEDHGAQVQCHFCNKTYTFTEQELIRLLERAEKTES